jgi:bifunctional enzyme CysN/CysC
MPWYQGSTLLHALETVDVSQTSFETVICPIQRVNRPHAKYRGFQGQLLSGTLHVNDVITLYPSLVKATVDAIHVGFENREFATQGENVDIQFKEHVDASRGQVIVKGDGVKSATQFQATLLWMDDQPLEVGKVYTLKCGTRSVSANIMSIKHKIDIQTSAHLSAKMLEKNDIGVVTLSVTHPLVFTPFDKFKGLGSFILIDRLSHMTSCAGIIHYDLYRSSNIHPQSLSVDASLRAQLKAQKPMTIWFLGLSGSGKSTIANALDRRLYQEGFHTMLLDGDNVRLGLNENLGFTTSDRHENIRRVAHVCKLMNDAGLIVFASLITPSHEDQYLVESILGENVKIVYVSTPLEECIRRDVKGLYQKAIDQKIPHFTGISAPFDVPHRAHATIDTSLVTIEDAVEIVYKLIKDK